MEVFMKTFKLLITFTVVSMVSSFSLDAAKRKPEEKEQHGKKSKVGSSSDEKVTLSEDKKIVQALYVFRDQDNNTILHILAQKRKLQDIKKILTGKDAQLFKSLLIVNNKQGYSPAVIAIMNDDAPLARFLLQMNMNAARGIINKVRLPGNQTLLHYAASKGFFHGFCVILKILAMHRKDFANPSDFYDFAFNFINLQDVHGKSALHYACAHGFSEIIEKMLNFGIYNPGLTDTMGNTPLACALARNDSVGFFIARLILKSFFIKLSFTSNYVLAYRQAKLLIDYVHDRGGISHERYRLLIGELQNHVRDYCYQRGFLVPQFPGQ